MGGVWRAVWRQPTDSESFGGKGRYRRDVTAPDHSDLGEIRVWGGGNCVGKLFKSQTDSHLNRSERVPPL